MERRVQRDGKLDCVYGTACGILVIALLVIGCAAAAHMGKTETYRGREVAANEVIVKFRGAAPELAGQPGLGDHIDETESVGSARAMRLHSRNRSVDELIRDLSLRSDVEYVEPNYVVHALAVPDDPYFGQLWGLSKIGASAAWDTSTGSASNVVAVVDTGIDYTHPDLAASVWSAPASFTVTIGDQTITCPAGSHGFNAITHTCDPMDDNNHGTHVSGTIAAAGNNGIGITGVNWQGSIMGTKFLDASGSGYLSDAIEAIDFAVQARDALGDAANVRVLSNSWTGGGFSQAFLDEINRANAHDMLFVAAAGNAASDNDVTPSYPSDYDAPNVVAVAATDSADALASFSSYGASTVDLGAPGVSILSTARGGTYATYSGTSMATPHVSGAALLVLSRCNLDTAHLKADLLGSVDPAPGLSGKTVTGGRLNVEQALAACSAPPRAPTTAVLVASPPDSVYGDDVVFTATVAPPDGSGTPTGKVTFSDSDIPLGTGILIGGVATLTTSALSGGLHSITATYGGDSGFSGSISPALLFSVNKADTTTNLVSLAKGDLFFGDQVTFEALVQPGTATGTVTFTDENVQLGTAVIGPGTGATSFSISTLAARDHPITATYNGDINYLASTSNTLTLTVKQATSTTTLTSSPNPSAAGQQVTLTATVTPAATAGTVMFYDGTGQLGTGTLSGGKASFSTSGLSTGTHRVTATYAGNSDVTGSTSPGITQTVTRAPPADFSISASPSRRTVGRGYSTSYAVSITKISGFSGTVTLGISGLPSRATGSFGPATIAAPGTSSTLTVRTKSNTPIGTYPLTIIASSGRITHKATVTLVVQRGISGFLSKDKRNGASAAEDSP
jgi:subtilisin family serine protease